MTPQGKPLVEGKQVAGFTNTEEESVELTDVVPFLVEDELKAKGALYSKGPDMKPHVVTDGLLITGQNPNSSGPGGQSSHRATRQDRSLSATASRQAIVASLGRRTALNCGSQFSTRAGQAGALRAFHGVRAVLPLTL